MKPVSRLLKRLRDFTARPLVRNVLKVLTGNLGGNGLNFVATAWLVFALNTAEFGVFTSMQTAMLLFASLSDFGLNTTLIKYYRDYVTQGRTDYAEAIMRRSLWARMVIVTTLALACIVLAGPITRYWMKDATLAGLFRLTCIGVLGASLWAFCQAAMQARQQFGLYAILTTINHALRLALIILVIHFGRMDVTTATLIMVFIPFVGVFSSARLWPRQFWTAHMEPDVMRQKFKTIFHFSKWVFLSVIIASIIMRLDVILLQWLKSKEEVGRYGQAMNLAQGIPLITAAISAVLLPKLAATRSRHAMQRITGIFLKATPLLAAMVALVIAAAHLILPLVKGGKYQACLPVFDTLVVAYSIGVIVNPISFFCLAFERSSWLTWMNLAQLVMSAAISLLLIPRFGAMGAAISSLAVRVFAIFFLALAYRRLLRLAQA